MFDEFEDLHMIQEHYCITVGVNTAGGDQRGEGGPIQEEEAHPRGRVVVGYWKALGLDAEG